MAHTAFGRRDVKRRASAKVSAQKRTQFRSDRDDFRSSRRLSGGSRARFRSEEFGRLGGIKGTTNVKRDEFGNVTQQTISKKVSDFKDTGSFGGSSQPLSSQPLSSQPLSSQPRGGGQPDKNFIQQVLDKLRSIGDKDSDSLAAKFVAFNVPQTGGELAAEAAVPFLPITAIFRGGKKLFKVGDEVFDNINDARRAGEENFNKIREGIRAQGSDAAKLRTTTREAKEAEDLAFQRRAEGSFQSTRAQGGGELTASFQRAENIPAATPTKINKLGGSIADTKNAVSAKSVSLGKRLLAQLGRSPLSIAFLLSGALTAEIITRQQESDAGLSAIIVSERVRKEGNPESINQSMIAKQDVKAIINGEDVKSYEKIPVVGNWFKRLRAQLVGNTRTLDVQIQLDEEALEVSSFEPNFTTPDGREVMVDEQGNITEQPTSMSQTGRFASETGAQIEARQIKLENLKQANKLIAQEDWFNKNIELEEFKEFNRILDFARQEELIERRGEMQKLLNVLILAQIKAEEEAQARTIALWMEYLKEKARLAESGLPSQLNF